MMSYDDAIAELEEQVKQQAAVIEQMREAMIAVLCDPEGVPCFEGSDGDRAVISETLTLQPGPEVLNKVRADAVREASKLAAVSRSASDAVFMIDNYAQRIEQGEA